MSIFSRYRGVLAIIVLLGILSVTLYTVVIGRINRYRTEYKKVSELLSVWSNVVNSTNDLLLTNHSYEQKIYLWREYSEEFFIKTEELLNAETLDGLDVRIDTVIDDLNDLSIYIRTRISEIDFIMNQLINLDFLKKLEGRQIGLLALYPGASNLPADMQAHLLRLNYTWYNFTSSSSYISNKLKTLSSITDEVIDRRIRSIYIITITIMIAMIFLCIILYIVFYKLNLRNEQEKSKLRSYVNNVINSMPSMVIAVDRNLQITLWNSEAERVTGVSFTEAAGQHIDSLINLIKLLAGDISESVKNNRTSQLNNIKDKNGELFDVLIFPLQGKDDIDAVIRLDNVTEKVQMQNMMIQAEKIMAMGGLAAGMAHEINNPLAGIIQNIQNIRRRLTDEKLNQNINAAAELGLDFGLIRKYMEKRGLLDLLDFINDSGIRASRIINNTMKFSRKSEFEKDIFNIEKIIDKSIELAENDYLLRKNYDFKNIRVLKKYKSRRKKILCSEIELQQVFFNLLINSSHAFIDKKVSEDFIPSIIFKIEDKGSDLKITVEDNGSGLSEEEQNRVFEPFYTTKSPGLGTGLGLSVSYMIICDRHQGTMQIDSNPGEGTVIIITLPVK